MLKNLKEKLKKEITKKKRLDRYQIIINKIEILKI